MISCTCWVEVRLIETSSATFLKVEDSIRTKLVAAQAFSREQAVSVQEANLDKQEQNWLSYVAGGLFAEVKKTKDRRYYVDVSK